MGAVDLSVRGLSPVLQGPAFCLVSGGPALFHTTGVLPVEGGGQPVPFSVLLLCVLSKCDL